MAYKPIESYGVIGDLHTVALVGMDGSIDWCCLPHFDSPSIFAAILDEHKGGFFKIASLYEAQHKQMYLPDSNVLVTRFLSPEGVGEVVDFMPVEDPSRGKKKAAGLAHAASPAAKRRPDRKSSRCSAFRRSMMLGITRGVMARSRSTTSRASSSRPICA